MKNNHLRYSENHWENYLSRLWAHLKGFWVVICIFILLLAFAFIGNIPQWVVYALIGLFLLYFLCRPMGVVYGLVGSSSSIRIFFINFIIITLAFSLIYYGLFFKDAGICYGPEKTTLDYDFFRDSTEVVRDSTEVENYRRISYSIVVQNSFLTSLTQGPSDFFFFVSDHGEIMNANTNDPDKTHLFSTIILLHTLVSWLFLGVFISLLYSKFRYEA